MPLAMISEPPIIVGRWSGSQSWAWTLRGKRRGYSFQVLQRNVTHDAVSRRCLHGWRRDRLTYCSELARAAWMVGAAGFAARVGDVGSHHGAVAVCQRGIRQWNCGEQRLRIG